MIATLESDFLVLHGLAVKKAGTAQSVGAVLGTDAGDVGAALNDAGRLIEAKGTYMLTPAGRSWLDEQYPTACAYFRSSQDFVNGYERFEVVNREILDSILAGDKDASWTSPRAKAYRRHWGEFLPRGQGEDVVSGEVQPLDLESGTRDHIEAVLQPIIDPEARQAATVVARGEPACPGIAAGLAIGMAEDAEQSAENQPVVLVGRSTSPEDVHGVIAAKGVCTEVGGRTSHAAVVSRELGRPAVVGCGEGSLQALIGELLTIDGGTGEIFAGELATKRPEVTEHPDLRRLMSWAEEHRTAIGDDHPLLEFAKASTGATAGSED